MDPNIIGWILIALANIAVVAFMYGRTSQKVSQCTKAIENGLTAQVQDHDSRLTRVETILEHQEAQGNRMETKFDMLLERSGLNPADWSRIKTQVDCQEKTGGDKLP